MKVLIVSNMFPNNKYPAYGIFVKNFCKQLSLIGIDYDLSVMYKSNTKTKKAFRYIKFYLSTFFKCLLKKYDIVYIHYASHSSLPVLMAKKINKNLKIYTNVHGSDVVPENPKQERMQKYTKRILKYSNKIVVPSKYFKNYVSNKYQITPEKIFVYPSGGINSSVFYPKSIAEKDSYRKKLKLDPKLTTFALIGRVSFKKGWDIFIKSINICEKNNIKANYVIVGDGPEDAKMLRLIKKYKLEDRITLLGLQNQQELAYIYNAINYLVFPTMREGESLGLVAIEALSCGCPVIASDYAAPSYYIQNGFNGFKFEKGNYQELASIIKKCVLLKKKQYNILTQNAYVSATPYFSKNSAKVLKKIMSENEAM